MVVLGAVIKHPPIEDDKLLLCIKASGDYANTSSGMVHPHILRIHSDFSKPIRK